MKKLATIGLLGIAGILALLLVACLAVFAALYSEWGRDWALAEAQEALEAEAGIVLEFKEARGSLPIRLTLTEVRVSQKGREFFSASELTLAPNLAALLAGRAGLGVLRLEDPALTLPFPDFGSGGSGGGSLPLVFFIRRLEIQNADISPNREWGPVEQLRGVDLSGRLRFSRWGFKFDAESLAGTVRFEGMPEPVRVNGKARLTSLDDLEVEGVTAAMGGNQATLSGSLNWKDDLVFKARAKGGFNDPAALPMAWPGPHPPRGEIGFDLEASGKIADCSLKGLLRLEGEKLGFMGRMDLATQAGDISLEPEGFNPFTWGLAGKNLAVTGKIDLKSPGPPTDPGTEVGLGLELSDLSLPDLLQAGVKAKATWHDNRLELASLHAHGGWGELRAKGHYAPAAKDRPESLGAEVKFSRLSPPPGLAKLLPVKFQKPELNGTLTASGKVSGMQLGLELARSPITPGLALDSLSAKATLTDFKPVLQKLELSLAGASLRAEGKADTAGADLAFQLDVPELATPAKALSEFAPGLESLQGDNLFAKGRLTGKWDGPGLDAELSADRVQAMGNSLENLRLTADLQKLGPKPLGKVHLAVEALTAGGTKLESLTSLARLTGKGLELEASTTGMGWKGEVGLSASGSGTQNLAAVITRLRLTPPGKKPWVLAKPAKVGLDRAGAKLQDFILKNAGQSISLHGMFKQATGEVDCALLIDDFKPGPWLGRQNVFPGAYLNFSATLSGKLSDPVMEMKGRFSGLALPKLPVMSLAFKGDYAKNKLAVGGLVATAGRPFFHLRAGLDLGLSLSPAKFKPDPEGMVDISLKGRDLPVHLFQPLVSGISQLDGKLGAHLTAKGPWRNVELSGNATLAGGACLVDATGQLFKGLNAKLNLNGRNVSIEYCSLSSKGEMKLSGSAELPGRNRAGLLDLRLVSKDFMVLVGNYGEADLATDITLSGDFKHPELKGVIRPEAMRLTIMERPSDDLDDVVILSPGQKPPPIRQDKTLGEFNPKGFLGSALVDLKLDLSRGLKIEAKQGWLDVSGGASVYKKPFEPMRFRDEIILEQGLVMLSGKRLKINEGSVDFGDKTIPDPALNMEATYSANSATIFITVAGTAQNPNLQLTSQPPMSRTDILSTIIFGKPANSLSADQNNRFQGAALALLGQQGVNLMRKVMGDTLTPDVVTVHNQDSGSSALEAGKYLSADLYLRYRQDLGEDGGRNVGLEYRLKPWLSLESQVGTTRDTGVDVIFNFDF